MATGAHISDSVLKALDTEAAIEEIVDHLIEEPGHGTDQQPDTKGRGVETKKKSEGAEVGVSEPVDTRSGVHASPGEAPSDAAPTKAKRPPSRKNDG